MPFYKLIFSACGNAFECRASIAARTEKSIACPECGSREVETDYAAGSAAVVTNTDPAPICCPHGGACCACGGKH